MAESISWQEFVEDINSLITKMSEFKPDVIVPSMRGGLVPAGILAEKLGIKDVRPISVERIGQERRVKYDVQGSVDGLKVLVIEDDLPTGLGFPMLRKHFAAKGAIVKYAAVYVNSRSEKNADFYAKKFDPLKDLPWKPSRNCDRIIA